MPIRILIVDDEHEILEALEKVFRRRDMLVQTASSAHEALAILHKAAFDVILTDFSMPDMSGVDLLKYLRAAGNNVPIIIMTGVGSIENAVEAVRFGAYDYIRKPVSIQPLEELVRRAVAQWALQKELESDETPPVQTPNHGDIPMVMGSSKALHDILETIEHISSSAVPVLINGETGTGKSLLAKHIHRSGSRANRPLMTIDCGALPENLLESELFGHVKGSFTGATQDRRGLLEEGGTIFLDEIGELTLAMQVKLLHAIQEKEIRPVGSNKSIRIDVQFITATNRDLPTEIKAGRFREDLYYRLAVIPLTLPPLRERSADMPAFVGYFVKKFNALYTKNITSVEPAAMDILLQQPWRGNVRELEHVIERAVLLAKGTAITQGNLGIQAPLPLLHAPSFSPAPSSLAGPIPLQHAVEEAERKAIAQALVVTDGNRTRAAEILGIGRRTLYSKLEEYGL